MAITDYIPKIDFSGYSSILFIFVVAIVFLILFGIGTYFFVRRLKFNRDITILEDVSGSDDLEPVGKDKAMLVKIGRGGLELLYLRKRKLYRGAYGKRMGKNKYYFAIGQDGYWYNTTLGSLDKGMQKINIRPTAVNMRYQNESLQEIIKARYEQPSFWSKYGAFIINIAFIAFIVVMSYFLFDSFKDAAGASEKAAEVTKETAIQLREIVGALDSLRSSGGGLSQSGIIENG
jgi:hypothetical protein